MLSSVSPYYFPKNPDISVTKMRGCNSWTRLAIIFHGIKQQEDRKNPAIWLFGNYEYKKPVFSLNMSGRVHGDHVWKMTVMGP